MLIKDFYVVYLMLENVDEILVSGTVESDLSVAKRNNHTLTGRGSLSLIHLKFSDIRNSRWHEQTQVLLAFQVEGAEGRVHTCNN